MKLPIPTYVFSLLLCLGTLAAPHARAESPTPAEQAAADAWTQQNWFSGFQPPPLDFSYGGTLFSSSHAGWARSLQTLASDSTRTLTRITFDDPTATLRLTCEVTRYHQLPAVEWVAWMENIGTADTAVVNQVQALSTRIQAPPQGPFRLHTTRGSLAQPQDFEPQIIDLAPDGEYEFKPQGGRSSSGAFPYFNVVTPQGGTLIALGWSGQWKASFYRDTANVLTAQAGMETTNYRLHPGEKVRTPSVLLLFWQGGNLDRAQNLLRTTLLDHFSPRPGGARLTNPPVPASGSGISVTFNQVTETNTVQMIQNMAAKNFPADTFWIDAGWNEGGFADGQGTWHPDPARFPNGLGPVGTAAHAAGYDFSLWFEPERVMPGSFLRLNHPAWLLTPSGLAPYASYQSDWRLFDFGNPAARQYAIDQTSAMITDFHIDKYRHDCNIDPSFYWQTGEASDRRGINEIEYITGLYAFLDALQAAHPNLLIDNCASGGRRLDIEMMRRSIAMLRTDFLWDPEAAQSMTQGLAPWIPLTGQGAVIDDAYDFRSGMGATMILGFDYLNPNAPFWDSVIDRTVEYLGIQELFQGDFYPLLPYTLDDGFFTAFQFDRPDRDAGLVQAFRRPLAAQTTQTIRLRGLNPVAQYAVDFFDEPGPLTMRYECETFENFREAIDLGNPAQPLVAPGSWQGARYAALGYTPGPGGQNANGAICRVPLTVTTAGTYALQASVIRSNDKGMLDFLLDGANRTTLDLYQAGTANTWSTATIASGLNLTPGIHWVTIEWIRDRRNPISADDAIFIDTVTLTGPAGTVTDDLETYGMDSYYNASISGDPLVWRGNRDCPPFSSHGIAFGIGNVADPLLSGEPVWDISIPFEIRTAGDYFVRAGYQVNGCGVISGTSTARVNAVHPAPGGTTIDNALGAENGALAKTDIAGPNPDGSWHLTPGVHTVNIQRDPIDTFASVDFIEVAETTVSGGPLDQTLSGAELMTNGLEVQIGNAPGSQIIRYTRLTNAAVPRSRWINYH